MQVQDLVDELDRNPTLEAQLKQDPKKALKDVARNAPIYQRDRWVYRVVVAALGATVLVAAAGSIVLQLFGHDTPASLIALGSAAIGAIAGLLAPSPTTTSG